MSWFSSVFCLITVACVAAQFPNRKPEQKVPELSQRCLDCMCQASSNCDETIKCHTSGGGYFCGPYVISWAYWHDGGRPGDKGKAHDFETCLNNKTCAEQAVRGYMRKYGQDCDGSGQIDCYDFTRIHKLGFSSCGGDAIYNTDYWEKFEICYDPNGQHGGYDNAGGYDQQGGYEPNQGFDNYGETVIQARSGGSQDYA